MGAMGLAGRIGQEMGKEISKEEGEDYMNRYFASYPSVKTFLDHTAKSAVQKGYSVTVAGRKRWYHKPEKDDPDYKKKISSIEREAKNHPIQGANADAVKYALVFLQERIKNEKIDGNLILTVHDEIVSEVREDQAQYWAQVQSDEMIRAAALFIKKVKIVSDPFVADVWEH
jgi:DNA polymerase-1